GVGKMAPRGIKTASMCARTSVGHSAHPAIGRYAEGMSERPDPDELLARIQADEELARRAKLKIFFGASAGVGKTYAMLVEAHERRRSGVDVVVGWVETHGRRETAAQLEGLEILPRGTVEHRGTRLEEFDLDAALKRKPALLLLDELAH